MLKKFLIGTLAVFALAFALNVSAAMDFGSTTLKVGSTGEYVKTLQTLVGASPVDGSFGPMTKAKVMAWQASNGLTADGLFGPMSMAKANAGGTVSTVPGCVAGAMFSSTTGAPCATAGSTVPGCSAGAMYSSTTGAPCAGGTVTTGGPLAGTAGSIADMNTLSAYNNEEIGAGQKDVKILGVDIEASNDGDIALNIMKVRFDSTGNASGDSDRLEDYVTSVSVWQGSTKVGTAMAADFSKESTGIYTKSIMLSNAVVRADKTEKFYVSVDAVNNLDSGDIDSDLWSVALDSVRFTDGSGVVTTETSAIPTDMDWDAANDGIAISFVSLATASDTILKISTENTPLAAIVDVHASNNTDDVVLLKGKMKLEGTSNVWLDEVPVTFTATGGSNAEALSGSVTLNIGGTEYSETMTAGAAAVVVTFNNLNLTLTAGSTVNFTVSADINDLDATAGVTVNFDAGDTLKAELLTTNRDDIIAENSGGDQLTDGTEMTGSALGEAQTFQDTGINVVLVSTSAVAAKGLTTQPDKGTYTITFDVTAFGGDMWVDGTKPTLTGTDSTDLNIVSPGTGTQDAVLTTSTGATMTGTINTTSRFKVSEGETERFTITSVVTPTVAGGLYSVSLASLAYLASDADITDAAPALEYTTNLVDFVTQNVNLVLVN